MSAAMSAMHNVPYPECDGENLTQSTCSIADGESARMNAVANRTNQMNLVCSIRRFSSRPLQDYLLLFY